MKSAPILTLILFLAAKSAVFSQSVPSLVDDTDLKLYVGIEDSVNSLKSKLMAEYRDLVVSDPLMASGKRFLEIRSMAKDQGSLADKVTADELSAFRHLEECYESYQDSLRIVKTELLVSELGIEKFNMIRRAIRENEEVRARYEIFARKEEVAL
ncbi:hypothetical protein FUAX_14970 [Fulvitalea axinellae]|uniref:DUF4142 domain-containing protein n=1 Tax=Fulvitalea axinellae TaxID=1182444 RepID=A0AAU9CIG6_9BACT|nr:hypothetical protein FUAX_14970 [Fulvitalea axinellae]